MISRSAAIVAALLALVCHPLDANAQESHVAVAVRDLARGVALTSSDFILAEDAPAETKGPVGWVTRRVVSKGEVLKSPAIAPADVIRSGDTVQLVWSDGSLEMRITGRAMNSAAVGEPVNVRVDTKRRFEGTALASGEVRLDSPESGRSR